MSIYRLDQTYVHKTATHECQIKWTRIGDESAPSLVFIHGTPWSNVVWHDLASALSTRYNIYLYDHPGFGDSPPNRRLTSTDNDDTVDLDAALKLRAEASAALIKHWNLSDTPHLIAHDNGGLVSLRLFLQHDIEIASLCLIDVVTSGSTKLPFFKLIAENKDIFNAVPPQLSEGFARGYIRGATYKSMPQGIEDLLAAPYLDGGSQGPKAFLREMIQAHNRDASDIENEYGSVGGRLPIKIIWGNNDTWLPADIAPKLKKTLNAEELVIVSEAGHLIHYDQPSKIALEVGLWLHKQCS